MYKSIAKPFVKWAGGKSQLINTYKNLLPKQLEEGKINTYAEPFVGGGAILFYVLQNYKIQRAIINDINKDLINCYKCIKTNVNKVIEVLKTLQKEYFSAESRQDYYYCVRARYNATTINNKVNFNKCADFIFLNKTCFNGLYRVNKNGEFNVPHGKYKSPLICDEKNLKLCSALLQEVEIFDGDYKNILTKVPKNCFIYLDPPYRPLKKTSFNSYDKSVFTDQEQIKLAEHFKQLANNNHLVLLSNCDPKNENPEDDFFDKLYKNYNITRVYAKRMINSNALKRGNITEIVVTNYQRRK